MKGASSTARLIAASIVLQDSGGVAAAWIPAPTIDLSRAMLEGDGLGKRLFRAALRRHLVRRACVRLERWLLPGIQAHYLLRKSRIAGWAGHAIDRGVTQAVILGAGMDGLGVDLRLRYPGLRVVEIDHPATQAVKRRALEKVAPACGVHLYPADIAQGRLGRDFARSGLARDDSTLVIAEGVLMYLDAVACRRLLRSVGRYFRGSLHGVLSTMELDRHGVPGFLRAHPLIGRWLRWRGEPFRWGANATEVGEVLLDAGFRLRAIDRGDEPPARPFPGWEPCTGETLFFASRSSE